MSECDTSFAEVVWRHLNLHLVAGKDLDVVHTHLSGDVGGDDVTVLKLHTEHCVTEGLDDHAVLFD